MVTPLAQDHFDEQAPVRRVLGAGGRLDYPQPVSPRTLPCDNTNQWALRGEAASW